VPDANLPSSNTLSWVYKRDGRLEEFDAGKISRALFAASESIGRPDSLTARELTDSIIHFLTHEEPKPGTAGPTTEQIADLATKVVRELGQPALARAFEEEGERRRSGVGGRKSEVGNQGAEVDFAEIRGAVAAGVESRQLAGIASAQVLREFSLLEVFARDVASAHREGIITLHGLEDPLKLAGLAVPGMVTVPEEVLGLFVRPAGLSSRFLAFDSLEHAVNPGDADQVACSLLAVLDLARTDAVANLNCAQSPGWAQELAEGPLFGTPNAATKLNERREASRLLLEALTSSRTGGHIRVDWHVSEEDFGPEVSPCLIRAAQRALERSNLWFVLDRKRPPVSLAEGLDRKHTAVLLTVGLDLPRLAALGPEQGVGRFLQRVASAARLALSAACQKRDFLRKHRQNTGGAGKSPFSLEQARLVLAPAGLDACVRLFTGQGCCAGLESLRLGCRIVEFLGRVLKEESTRSLLETCVDGVPGEQVSTGAESQIGVTPADPGALMGDQLRAAGALHAAAGGVGTATVFLPRDRFICPDEIVQLLHFAWKETAVARVRFIAPARSGDQLRAPWETSG
jgi:hypothetical protein